MIELTYTCAQCGGTFTSERPDEEAHAEAKRDFGKDGRQPGMVVICDDCYREIVGPPAEPIVATAVACIPPSIAPEEFAELVRRQVGEQLDARCRVELKRMLAEFLFGRS